MSAFTTDLSKRSEIENFKEWSSNKYEGGSFQRKSRRGNNRKSCKSRKIIYQKLNSKIYSADEIRRMATKEPNIYFKVQFLGMIHGQSYYQFKKTRRVELDVRY